MGIDKQQLWAELHQPKPKFTQIEIHAADHCVQKCQHCSHAADIAPKALYSPEDYEPHFQLMARKGIHWHEIHILGGEPFINPKLATLAKMCHKYAHSVSIMTNLYWLKNEQAIDEHSETLTNTNKLIITHYSTLLPKGGMQQSEELIQLLREQHPKLQVHQFQNSRKGPITSFAKIQFHDDPKPIINNQCSFRNCKQLLHTGQILGCCAARRTNLPAIDRYDISEDLDAYDLWKWLNKPTLDLCHHCSIATTGIEPQPWQLVNAPTSPATNQQDQDQQDHTSPKE